MLTILSEKKTTELDGLISKMSNIEDIEKYTCTLCECTASFVGNCADEMTLNFLMQNIERR